MSEHSRSLDRKLTYDTAGLSPVVVYKVCSSSQERDPNLIVKRSRTRHHPRVHITITLLFMINRNKEVSLKDCIQRQPKSSVVAIDI